LLLTTDDGIVVVEVGKGNAMDAALVPAALGDRLGPDATAGLLTLFDSTEETCVDTVVTRAVDRFERRLTEEVGTLRVEMLQGDAALRQEMAQLRLELRQDMGTMEVGLRRDMGAMEVGLRRDMSAMEVGLRQEMGTLAGGLRQEMTGLRGDLRQELANQKFDLLKWSFLFWIGQVVTTAGVVGMLLGASGR
jgi:hypothetical protein